MDFDNTTVPDTGLLSAITVRCSIFVPKSVVLLATSLVVFTAIATGVGAGVSSILAVAGILATFAVSRFFSPKVSFCNNTIEISRSAFRPTLSLHVESLQLMRESIVFSVSDLEASMPNRLRLSPGPYFRLRDSVASPVVCTTGLDDERPA